MLHLVDIDDTNWRIPLTVSNDQKLYVANTTTILARAYAYRNSRSRAFLVYRDDEPIGMGLYYDCEPDAYIFSELLIDKQYQGQGYGKEAKEYRGMETEGTKKNYSILKSFEREGIIKYSIEWVKVIDRATGKQVATENKVLHFIAKNEREIEKPCQNE